MHSAPAVRYPVARPSRVGLAALALWSAGAALCGWWSLQSAVPAWAVAVALASVLASGLVAVAQWQALPEGELQWDGGQWWWTGRSGDDRIAIRLALDFGAAMLVQLHDWPGRAPWCLVERRSMPSRWMDLRRAMHGPGAAQPA